MLITKIGNWVLNYQLLKLTSWLEFDTGIYLKYGKEKNGSYDLFTPGFNAMPYDPWSMRTGVIL